MRHWRAVAGMAIALTTCISACAQEKKSGEESNILAPERLPEPARSPGPTIFA